MAAGVAREIRSPITTMKGFAQLLQESLQGEVLQDVLAMMFDHLTSSRDDV